MLMNTNFGWILLIWFWYFVSMLVSWVGLVVLKKGGMMMLIWGYLRCSCLVVSLLDVMMMVLWFFLTMPCYMCGNSVLLGSCFRSGVLIRWFVYMMGCLLGSM